MLLAIYLASLYIYRFFYNYSCLIVIAYNEAERQIAQISLKLV